MTNTEFIEKLYKKEADLIRICNYHGIYGEDSKDTIQDLYVKIYQLDNHTINRYVLNNEPNMYIIFIVLRNMISNSRKKNKNIFEELNINLEILDESTEKIDMFNIMSTELDKIEYWFDRTLLTIYINEHHTIRSLASGTKISSSTIQKVFRSFKLKCLDEYNKRQNQI